MKKDTTKERKRERKKERKKEISRVEKRNQEVSIITQRKKTEDELFKTVN